MPSRLLFAAIVLTIASTWISAPPFGAEPVAEESAAATSAESKGALRGGIIVYYFHGTRRCNTCRTIEAYAKEAVEGKFSEQLKSGQLRWNVVNTDEPENEHFVEDFGLVSSSLVIVQVDGDKVARHQILQDAWTLVRDKSRFIEYVRRSVGEYLKS
jgi:hypothetical protein